MEHPHWELKVTRCRRCAETESVCFACLAPIGARKLVEDLGSKDEGIRANAAAELEKLAEKAWKWLRDAKGTDEAHRKRIEEVRTKVRATIEGKVKSELRYLRRPPERCGTPRAMAWQELVRLGTSAAEVVVEALKVELKHAEKAGNDKLQEICKNLLQELRDQRVLREVQKPGDCACGPSGKGGARGCVVEEVTCLRCEKKHHAAAGDKVSVCDECAAELKLCVGCWKTKP